MRGLIVFDCDGTLVDSQYMIVAAMTEAFGRYGLAAPDAAEVRRVVGLSLPEAVWRLRPDLDSGLGAAVSDEYKRAFRRLREGGGREPLYPHAREVIRALDGGGYLLGVATGKSRRGLAAVLDHHELGGYFVTLQTAEDAPGKPHPAMLRQAMAEAGTGPEETIMIGDTSFDMEMARAAGVAALGVGWGYHAPEELISFGAVRVLAGFAELPQAADGLLARPAQESAV